MYSLIVDVTMPTLMLVEILQHNVAEILQFDVWLEIKKNYLN